MKIFLTDQSNNFPKHLEYLQACNVISYDRSKLIEKVNTIIVVTNKQLPDLDLDFFFNYNIFPGNIMSFLTQWNYEKRQMQVGDTIVQQAFIPPLKSLSTKLVFGVRINKIFNEINKRGFSYETLEGHVEMGESSFTLETNNEGQIIFKIHTFSKPGNKLTQLFGPVFSVPYQTFCTKKALQYVKQQVK